MRGAQRLGRVRAVDGHRDVALGRALRDRQDVDLGAAQRLEQPRGHAGLPGHAVADRGQHADAGGQLHALHLAHHQFVGERGEHRVARTFGLVLAHHAADGMFGRPLRDHHHRHPRVAQCGEHALGGAGHADQAGAFEVEHGQVRAQGQPLDRAAGGAAGGDAGARVLGLEGVADDDRQAALDRRRHGLRMHHLGAEIGQFAGFVVAERFQLHRFGHDPRVRREHAVDVGPDVQLGGVEQRGEDRAGVVAAVAAEGGDAAGAVAGDEAGDHDARLRVLRAPLRQALRAGGPVHVHAQLAAVDHQDLARIQHRALLAQRTQVVAEQLRRVHLAQPLHAVQHFPRQFADHRQRGEDLGQVLEARVQPFDRGAGMFAEQGHCGGAMAGTGFVPALAPVAVATRGQFGQADQRIGDPLHRRDDGDLETFRARQQQLRDMTVAFGIGHRGAAELVHDGGGGERGVDGGIRRSGDSRSDGGGRHGRPRSGGPARIRLRDSPAS
ncbi:hypothetical protein NB705_002464 [Xanthomonas sacchari]|nr:hypothetical protein [Xanthomonas sacchari]